MLSHQAFNPTTASALTLATQFGMHSRAAIGFPTGIVDLTHTFDQTCIFVCAFTKRPVAPGVVTTGADTEQATQTPHRIVLLLLLNEGEAFTFRAEVNAIAFFNRSCSTFNCS